VLFYVYEPTAGDDLLDVTIQVPNTAIPESSATA
jgi:hypothetical protein